MFSAWHKQVAGWAILAQAASPPAIMILFWVVLWCAGSFQFDVSGAVRRNAHGHHQGAEGSLWVAQRSSGGLHCDCRRLEGRHKVAGSAPRPCGDCSLGEVTTGGWQLPQCCASFSCGAGVEPSETNSAHQEWWRLGLLDRRFTFSRAEDDGSLGGDDDYTRGPTGEKVQDDANSGSKRRRRFRGPVRGSEGTMVSAIHAASRRMATGRGRSDAGATKYTPKKSHSIIRTPGGSPKPFFWTA